ncbi:MAG: hypothetical protein JJ971_08275 [Balneolaceae bacterium]|nr:hypothetical protein [Balneolaceae bacterium]MBO6546766.1 hypothetical protein [Balneolaceae bacterium]MBO6649126.1 hypothetical protein [Balneolaceae bacterium]
MKKSIFLFVLASLIISTDAYSQRGGGNYGQSYTSLAGMQLLRTDIIITKDGDGTKGTPFYNDKFVKGVVYLPNKKTTETLSLALNLEDNHLIYKEGDKFKIFNPEIIEGIAFQDELGNTEDFFVTGFSSSKNGINKNTALRVIYNGEIKMFAHHTVEFDRGNFRDPVTNMKVQEYKKDVDYYIRGENGEFKKTRLRLKNLVKDIGEFEKELKDFAKQNKIKGKSESDAFRILEYYDSLKEDEPNEVRK